ncbi:MAG: ATP-binding cassette domain-containing protein [Ruminococcus sp.]|nr:ATP-binding cassette domain-containing protein [Ruminococcus sp.]
MISTMLTQADKNNKKFNNTFRVNAKRVLKKVLVALLVTAFWIGVWQLVYMLVAKDIVIPSPLNTVLRLGELLKTPEFWKITASSVVRILLGYTLGVVLGVVLAVATSMSKLLYAIFKPAISIARATPVASLTLIIIMWVTNWQVPLAIVGLMVFPIIWGNTYEGIKETDKKLLEMSRTFRVGTLSRLLYVYIPSVYPYFITGVSSALGLAWKSGIAAEILGTTQNSVGQQLNDAKVYLDSEGKFAWTAVVVILSMILEFAVVNFLKKSTLRIRLKAKSQKDSVNTEVTDEVTLRAEDVSKTFGEKEVLKGVSLSLRKGYVIGLRGVSGAGKTTLLRILSGLTRADSGTVESAGGINYLYQENRLLPWLTAKENILYVNRSADTDYLLSLVSLQGEEDKYPSELSGGMKRRLAIARALAGKGETLFLDEPFTGLDKELLQNVSENVFRESSHKSVLLVTHNEEELQKYANSIVDI